MLHMAQFWARLRAARWLWMAVLAFAVTRLGILLVAYIATPIVLDPTDPPRVYKRPDNIMLDVFSSRWDSSFYVDIAREGYKNTEVPLPWVAFFPLLPLLIRGGMLLVGDPLVAGLVITNTALLLATMLLHRLADHEWGQAVADRSVWYLLIFPTAFYGSAIYADPLLLLGVIAAFFCARTGRWTGAAIAGFMAALSRPVGVLIAPVLLVEWWMQRRSTTSAVRPSLWALRAPMAAVLGLAMYMLYLQYAFNDPLAFVHAQASWGRERSLATLLDQLVQRPAQGWRAGILMGNAPINNWIDGGFMLLFAGLGLILMYQRRWSEGTFVLLNLLVTLNGGAWMAQRRHVWILFPGLMLLARWGSRPWVDRAIITLFALGLSLFTAMFANWYWVA
jgi:Gpi18-like mannosyltransferase